MDLACAPLLKYCTFKQRANDFNEKQKLSLLVFSSLNQRADIYGISTRTDLRLHVYCCGLKQLLADTIVFSLLAGAHVVRLCENAGVLIVPLWYDAATDTERCKSHQSGQH